MGKLRKPDPNELQLVMQNFVGNWTAFFPKVCASYGTGHRERIDAMGAGHGMLQAAVTVYAFCEAGMPMASGLSVPPGIEWESFARSTGALPVANYC